MPIRRFARLDDSGRIEPSLLPTPQYAELPDGSRAMGFGSLRLSLFILNIVRKSRDTCLSQWTGLWAECGPDRESIDD